MTAAVSPDLALFRERLHFLPPRVEAAPQDFGTYEVEFLPLAASRVRQPAIFEVDEDHAFLIVAASVLYLTNANAVVGDPASTPIPELVTVGIQSSSRQFVRVIPRSANMDDAPIDNWFGMGKQLCYWPYPVILPPNTRVQVLLTNLEAVSRNVRLTFLGARLYRKPSMDPWAYFRSGW